MVTNKKEPLFSISVAARLVGISPRVLRSYEEASLIYPYRTEGNTRLYSEHDIKKLKIINYLNKDKEVNLSGIKVIFKIMACIKLDEENENNNEKGGIMEKDETLSKIMEIAPELLGNKNSNK